MERLLRQRSEIFALLANVANLAELEQWRKEKLVADVRAAGMLRQVLTVNPNIKLKTTDKRLIASWGNDQIPNAWLPVWSVHPWVYKLITGLLEAGHVEVAEFHKQMIRPIGWTLDNGRVQSQYDLGELSRKELWIHLVRIVLTEPFPFRRCALCRTIFFRHGKQKFCSKQCTDKAVGSRNEYMRTYMAKRRHKARKKRKLMSS